MLRIGFILPTSHYLRDPFRGVPFTHLQILTVLEEKFGDRVELCLIDLRGVQREFSFYHIPPNPLAFRTSSKPPMSNLLATISPRICSFVNK